MLQVISFILNCVIDFGKMLFTINIGNGLNLGLLCCIIFIFLPILLRIVYFLRGDMVEELNQRYDESRPVNSFHSTYTEDTKLGKGKYYTYTNTVSKRRRMR